jgi:hypothetical protein
MKKIIKKIKKFFKKHNKKTMKMEEGKQLALTRIISR